MKKCIPALVIGCVLNDNFCDCGWDEPLTSACAGSADASFLCTNPGGIPQRISASRVHDGICDCCDGADESFNCHFCTDMHKSFAKNWARWNGSLINATIPSINEMQSAIDAEIKPPPKRWRATESKALRNLKKSYFWEVHIDKIAQGTPPGVLGLDHVLLFCYPLQKPIFLYPVKATLMQQVCNVACRDAASLPPTQTPKGPVPPFCVFQTGEAQDAQAAYSIQPLPDSREDRDRLLLEASVFIVSKTPNEENKEFFFLKQREELAKQSFLDREGARSTDDARRRAEVFRHLAARTGHFNSNMHAVYGLCLELVQKEFSYSTAHMEQWRQVQYRICFFGHATMIDLEDPNARPILIGTAIDALTFRNGHLCAEMGPRQLDVELTCGESQLQEVRNYDKCRYTAYATHPSGCKALGPFTSWNGPPMLPGESIELLPNWAHLARDWVMRPFFRCIWSLGAEWISLGLQWLLDAETVDAFKISIPTWWDWKLETVRDFNLIYPHNAGKLPQTLGDIVVTFLGCLLFLKGRILFLALLGLFFCVF